MLVAVVDGVAACWDSLAARRFGPPAEDSTNMAASATAAATVITRTRDASRDRPSAAVSSATCVSPESAAPRARANWASTEATTRTARCSSSGPVIASSSEREPIRYRLSGCEPFRPKAVLSQSIKPVLSREMVVLVLIAPLRVSMTESETDSRSRMHTAVFSCPLARAILFAHAWWPPSAEPTQLRRNPTLPTPFAATKHPCRRDRSTSRGHNQR